jgi:hypothetical protein
MKSKRATPPGLLPTGRGGMGKRNRSRSTIVPPSTSPADVALAVAALFSEIAFLWEVLR